jgi:diguanylate cyclase (GGDEF)-like protein
MEVRTHAGEPGVRPETIRRRILIAGAAGALAIVLATFVAFAPISRARVDLAEINARGLPVQAQLVALRTTLADWQLFLEPQLDAVTPGVPPDPTLLAKGAQLATAQIDRATALERSLRRVGFASDARELHDSMAVLTSSIGKLTPIASGKVVPPAVERAVIALERNAFAEVWAGTARISAHLSQDVTGAEIQQATDRLELGRLLFLLIAGLNLLVVVIGAVVFSRSAGRQARVRQQETLRHAYESRLQQALEMTRTETDVYNIVSEALVGALPDLKIEMLIADSSRAHFRRALSTATDFEGCGVVSPLDCPAAISGQAVGFASSGALDACPYLKDRPSGACSAMCLPVSIAGHTIGVTHAVGHDGILPPQDAIDALKFTSRRGSDRIAMIRAFSTSESQASTDPLTGLLNRRSLEHRVRDLHSQGIPYALAYGDLDDFKALNDTHGHETGDQALRAFAHVLRDAVRPNDIVARYGGEEFVIVLPDCETAVAVGVLERVRERLAQALSAGRVPQFTVTFGLASTAYADGFDEVVACADGALLRAKGAGGNRVLVADLPLTTGS